MKQALRGGYRSKEDHDLAHEWMEKHRLADELVFDTDSGMVIQAIYYEPVARFYQEQWAKIMTFFKELSTETSNESTV